MPRARKRIQRPFRRRLLSHTVTAADQELCYGSAIDCTLPTNSFSPSHHGLISSVPNSTYAPFLSSASSSSSTPVVIGGNYNHNNSLQHHHYGAGKVPTGSPTHFLNPEGSGDMENSGSPERLVEFCSVWCKKLFLVVLMESERVEEISCGALLVLVLWLWKLVGMVIWFVAAADQILSWVTIGCWIHIGVLWASCEVLHVDCIGRAM